MHFESLPHRFYAKPAPSGDGGRSYVLQPFGRKGGAVMRMTVDLPAELLNTAMEAGNCATQADTIRQALEMMVRSAKQARLRSLRGSMPDFNIDLDVTRDRK